MNITVASTQFDLRSLASAAEFWQRVEQLTQKAAKESATLLQFPEYFSLSWLLNLYEDDFKKALLGFSAYENEFHDKFSDLAKRFKMVIVAGTAPVKLPNKLVNRCYIYLPDGTRKYQDKQHMTRFESEEWFVVSGDSEITVFEWQGARWGVAICYDVEFPEYVRKLVEKDVDIIVVPSCTDDVNGYWRVRHCAEARAVESQSYVIMSSIVGGDSKHPEINVHHGAAGFFTPCDVGFPEGGVLATGSINREDVHTASLDLPALKKVRINGTVLNRRDHRN